MGSPCNGVQSLYSTATKGPISFIVLDVFFNDKSSNHKMPIQYVLPMWKSFYSTGRNFHLSLFGAFPLPISSHDAFSWNKYVHCRQGWVLFHSKIIDFLYLRVLVNSRFVQVLHGSACMGDPMTILDRK